MSEENKWNGFNFYMVEARANGDAVSMIVPLSKDEDWDMSDSKRRAYMCEQIRPLAHVKFGEGVAVTVTYIKGKATTLHL